MFTEPTLSFSFFDNSEPTLSNHIMNKAFQTLGALGNVVPTSIALAV